MYLQNMFKQKSSWLFMLLFLFVAEQSRAQLNYLEKGNKLIYFGIHLGFNQGAMKPLRNVSPGSTDSVTFVNSTFGPGFNIGIIGNYQFHKYFDLRLIPTLSFSDRNLIFRDVNNVEIPKTLSSIYLSFPLMFRYKSKPIKDFRIFVLGGIRYDFDLSAKSSRRNADDQILLQTHDISFETGFGFQFYLPYVILSPEFKVSHGLINRKFPNENLIYSRAIDKLFSRMFTISINLEG